MSFSDHYGKFVLVSNLQCSSIAISATLYHVICAKKRIEYSLNIENCQLGIIHLVRVKGVVKPYIWDTSYICDTCYMLHITPDDCWIVPTSLDVWETSAIKHLPKTKSKNFENLSYSKLNRFKL